jgi:hypothetical protein
MSYKIFLFSKSKNKNNLIILFLTIFSFFLYFNFLEAIEIRIYQGSSKVNEVVKVEILAGFVLQTTASAKPSCSIEINFGDKTGWIDAGTCTDINCSLTVSHTYKSPGIYTITVRSKKGSCIISPSPPDPVTTTIKVECESLSIISSSTFPPVSSGQQCKFEIQTLGGHPPINFSIVSGSLPQGLSLETGGIISGIPKTPGNYTFTVEVSDTCPIKTQTYRKTFSIKVIQPSQPFRIKRLKLYFENKKEEITVKRNEKDLKAFAEIQFEGSGLIQGNWEVDGKILFYVNKFVSMGGNIIISTPDLPVLPTLEAGIHKVRFVIKNQDILIPEIRYFVSAEEFKKLTLTEDYPPHLPGQILLLTKEIKKEDEFLKRIIEKFNLTLIDSFLIKSLQLKITILYTKEDIFKIIKLLKKEKGVIFAQPNYIFKTMEEPMADLQNINKLLNLKKLHEHYRGKGVKVAIIDTGVDTQHFDLKERILYWENFLKDSPYNAEIHGTAIAGVIGAGINQFGIEGIAPESEILALRACKQVSEEHPEGECYTSSIVKAIDFAIQKNANVVNMSFGSIGKDRIVSKLIEEGSKRKIIFVAPSGNLASQKELPFPASHPDVISVGGMDEEERPYPNKEIASKVDVLAPAMNVFTTIPGNRHNFLSGTSFSSAIVSGIIVLCVERNGSMKKKNFPPFKGSICKWQEELIKIPLCEK